MSQKLTLTIVDHGNGFTPIHHFDHTCLRNPNGRGIYKARKIFASVEHLGKGNEVLCIFLE